MKRLLTALAVLAVAGCGAVEPVEKADPASRKTPVTRNVSPAPALSTSPPSVPYVLTGRLHVGTHVVPGRFAGAVVRGTTWLGWERWGEDWSWGVGATRHPLPAAVAVKLSPGGRFLATVAGGEHCLGVGLNEQRRPCVVTLVDTSGADRTRRVEVDRTVVLVGVTDSGAVVLTEGAALRWSELVWDAAGGATDVVPLEESPRLREWAMQGWEPRGFGHAGFEFSSGNVPGRWLGEIVDGELQVRFQIPVDLELGPGGAWAVGNAWTARRPPGALEATTAVLEARRLGRRGGLGPLLRLSAPSGWFFARMPSDQDVVVWEDRDTLVARVVDARQGGDRLARCNLRLAACVLVTR